jgi:hypothetical protein
VHAWIAMFSSWKQPSNCRFTTVSFHRLFDKFLISSKLCCW